jgi:BirA family transcriptional regulator, biotin operon repressor / biotin---[acetyl-CoA-carboxylase] ligase
LYKIPANTLFVGKNLVFVPECHSTNDLAIQLSHQSNTPEGTVVITNHQTSGRGQRGNTWEATPGQNFTFSLLIKPVFLSVADQFYLPVFTSLALLDYLKEKTSETIQIKWPNDILIKGKKIAGVLIENQLQGGRFSNSIIGIGLNMNQKMFDMPTATSLYQVTGVESDLVKEHETLLEKLERRYLQLKQKHYKEMKDAYLTNLYWINEEHTFSGSGVEFSGVISGINEMGKLMIETAQGARHFDIKEVTYIQ